MVNLKIRCI